MKKHNTSKVVLWVVAIVWLLAAVILPDENWANLVKAGITLAELILIIVNVKEKNNVVKVVLVTTIAFMLLSWILPAAYYSSGYIDQGRVQMGLFDLFNYSLTSLSYFGYVCLFVLAVGGFYGILYKIPAYRSFLDKIVALCKGKEGNALSVMMILLAVITSVCGLQFGLMLFFPMLAAIILLMGYDKIVVALTLVGSTMIGVAGTTYGYSNVSILFSGLGLDITDNILVKVVILVAGLVLLIFNTLMYARSSKVASKAALKAEKKVIKTEEVEKEPEVVEEKVVEEVKVEEKVAPKKTTTTKGAGKNAKSAGSKKNSGKKTTNSNKKSSKSSKNDNKAASKGDEVIVVKESLVDDSLEQYVPTVVDSKHKIWPIVVGFVLLFVIMILAFFPWYDVFGIEAFTNASTAVQEFELFGFPIFYALLGTFSTFGEWAITDMFLVMLCIDALLVFIYKVKLDDVFEGFANGVKKALAPAFLILLTYTCLVITTYHPFQTAIYEAIFGLTEGFNVVTTTIAAFLAGLFNGDPSYAFNAIVYHFSSVVTNTDVYPIAGILFQSIYGVSMLVAPTSVVLVAVLNYLGVSFKKWFKAIWKLLVELLVVLLIVFTILLLI